MKQWFVYIKKNKFDRRCPRVILVVRLLDCVLALNLGGYCFG